MHALRERERVLELLEGVTGGRFHPNFNRIGGVKPAAGAGANTKKVIQDIPSGFLADTKVAMERMALRTGSEVIPRDWSCWRIISSRGDGGGWAMAGWKTKKSDE